MAKDPQALYEKLHSLSLASTTLHSIESLLHWDQSTYLPKGAIGFRARQIEEISHLIHKQHTSPSFRKALNALIDIETGEIVYDSLDKRQIAALQRWRKDYLHATKLPASFIRKFASDSSHSTHAWTLSKEKNDYKSFAPHLQKMIDLNRKKADYLGYKEHPYDALLDLYEPDIFTAQLTQLFGHLKIELTSLVKEIVQKFPSAQGWKECEFPKDKQHIFLKTILGRMGFSEDTFRLDESAHPFCSGLHPKDVRMTTHTYSHDPLNAIFSTLHEAGHGLYDMHLPEEHFGSPLAEAISFGIHESQSRFWETIIGQSLPFWTHFYPVLQEHFPLELKDISLPQFYRIVNHVKPSLIRIESDEVTYCLHNIIRFEIEKALLEGKMKVKELPEVWEEKMRAYLGVVPRTDAEGCLQDIHWSLGYFGYFPSYALGNLYAAQLFGAFKKSHPNWQDNVSKGDLFFIKEWLKENVHKHGREFTSAELLERITNSPLKETNYINYLKEKYNGISKA